MMPAGVGTAPAPAGAADEARARFTREEARAALDRVLSRPPAGRVPTSTYRLQFGDDFGFREAAAVAPYLRRLGVGDAYLSPFLAARSTHGYDVTDHGIANPALGGDEGFTVLRDALQASGLGAVEDVVPNHMGLFNPWFFDVLENGQA
ncbi:MAG TPA: alpha-amylase family glycosyl hydrolase, partial [Deinococcales bacterium]|nr:alpha-amylase family glycosyl hydrolase [Deinococcales bacterium]